MRITRHYFKNLDAIRFIAAMMVFLQHGMSESFKYLPIQHTPIEKILNLLSSGGTGVSIFFVLSGFLITYLLIEEYQLHSKIALKNFYIRRILRIWPLYFFVVFFSFIFYPLLKNIIGMNNPLGSNFIYHLFFLSNFDVIHIQKFCEGCDALSQNITWSVSIEEQFYLFWPLLFVFLPKRIWLFAILAVIFISIYFRILHKGDNSVLYFHTLSVLVDLGIGGLMAYLVQTSKKISSFFEQTSTKMHLFYFLFFIVLAYFGDVIFAFRYGDIVSKLASTFSFALIIVAQALTKSDSILNLSRLSFASKWGKYTYGIYLLHPIVITLLGIVIKLFHIPQNNFLSLFVFGIVAFMVTLMVSKLSYTYFESKFLLLKNKFEVAR